jgi:universal stress protein A
MTTLNSSARLKLDNILAATDLSAASKAVLLYAIPIARRHEAKLFIIHVSSSESPGNVLDAWRAAQTGLMDYFMAGHFKDVRHELLVKSGDVWTVLSQLIADYGIDLVVVGSRGRTGVAKFLLGSVAERIFRQAPCPSSRSAPAFRDRIRRPALNESWSRPALRRTRCMPWGTRCGSRKNCSYHLLRSCIW